MPDIFVAEKGKTTEPAVPQNIASVVKDLRSKKRPSYIHRLEGHYHNPLSAFCYFPDGIKFIAKDSEEEIVLFLRRHPITNFGWILVTLILLFAPAVLGFFPILSFLPDSFQLIAVAIWYLITVAYVLESFLDWFFNVCIITDERIFDVDFVNLVYREISEAKIEQVQDVTVKMGGVIRTIFNYGDVFIQTASEVPRIEFEAIPKPDRAAKILRELIVQEEQEKVEGRVR